MYVGESSVVRSCAGVCWTVILGAPPPFPRDDGEREVSAREEERESVDFMESIAVSRLSDWTRFVKWRFSTGEGDLLLVDGWGEVALLMFTDDLPQGVGGGSSSGCVWTLVVFMVALLRVLWAPRLPTALVVLILLPVVAGWEGGQPLSV